MNWLTRFLGRGFTDLAVEDHPLVLRAKSFATAAHGALGQRRKYTGVPYIEHPAKVAHLVAQALGTPEPVAAAWLHDVVNETGITLEQIRDEFGTVVAILVEGLTGIAGAGDGDRSHRKALGLARLASQSPACKTILVAKIVSETHEIVDGDPAFARVYLAEKIGQLSVMMEGDRHLLAQARRQVIAGAGKLELMP